MLNALVWLSEKGHVKKFFLSRHGRFRELVVFLLSAGNSV